jgi:hypothetical protein
MLKDYSVIWKKGFELHKSHFAELHLVYTQGTVADWFVLYPTNRKQKIEIQSCNSNRESLLSLRNNEAWNSMAFLFHNLHRLPFSGNKVAYQCL